jgi:hypothetical protein
MIAQGLVPVKTNATSPAWNMWFKGSSRNRSLKSLAFSLEERFCSQLHSVANRSCKMLWIFLFNSGPLHNGLWTRTFQSRIWQETLQYSASWQQSTFIACFVASLPQTRQESFTASGMTIRTLLTQLRNGFYRKAVTMKPTALRYHHIILTKCIPHGCVCVDLVEFSLSIRKYTYTWPNARALGHLQHSWCQLLHQCWEEGSTSIWPLAREALMRSCDACSSFHMRSMVFPLVYVITYRNRHTWNFIDYTVNRKPVNPIEKRMQKHYAKTMFS